MTDNDFHLFAPTTFKHIKNGFIPDSILQIENLIKTHYNKDVNALEQHG